CGAGGRLRSDRPQGPRRGSGRAVLVLEPARQRNEDLDRAPSHGCGHAVTSTRTGLVGVLVPSSRISTSPPGWRPAGGPKAISTLRGGRGQPSPRADLRHTAQGVTNGRRIPLLATLACGRPVVVEAVRDDAQRVASSPLALDAAHQRPGTSGCL